MRVQPKAWIGIGAWLLYLVVIVGLQGTSGIPYTDFGASPQNLWRVATLSLVVGGAVMVGLSIWLGWWGAALSDRARSGARWTLISPIIYLVMSFGTLASADWGRLTTDYLLAAIGLGVAVGFAEEFVCRGLLLVGLRGSMREVAAWFLTCLLFGMMHGINILMGAPAAGTVAQIVSAGLQGSALYVLRRVTGSLVWAMLLHGLWDFAVFANLQSGGGTPITQMLTFVAWPLAVICGLVVALRTDRGSTEDYARRAR